MEVRSAHSMCVCVYAYASHRGQPFRMFFEKNISFFGVYIYIFKMTKDRPVKVAAAGSVDDIYCAISLTN